MTGKPHPTTAPPLVPGSRRGRPGRPLKGDNGIFKTPEPGHNMGTAMQETQSRSGASDRTAVQRTNARLKWLKELTPWQRMKLALEQIKAAKLLDLHGAAVYLGLSEWTVRALEQQGLIPRVRVPLPNQGELRKLLFDKQDLDQLIETWKSSE